MSNYYGGYTIVNGDMVIIIHHTFSIPPIVTVSGLGGPLPTMLLSTDHHNTVLTSNLCFIPNKKRNAPHRTVQLPGKSQVIGQFRLYGAKVCQVLLHYTPFAIRHQKCVKENWL